VDALSGSGIFSGTVGNDDPTITAGDSITGSGAADIFAIISTGTTGTVAGVQFTGIETVRVSDTSTLATTVNLAGITGVETLSSFGSAHTNTLTFSNVGAIVDLTLSNTSGTGAHTVTYTAATVAGTADTQSITLDTASNTGETTVAGVETVAIAASGFSSIDLVAAAATAVTVDAADATTVTLSNAANVALATVTGAGEGAVTYVLDYSLGELAVTGGAGNDVFNISAAAMGANDTLDGGDGTADKLLFVSAVGAVTSIAGAAATTTIANVEVLELQGDDDGVANTAASFAIDLDTTEGITSILLDANDTVSANSFTLTDINATQMAAISAQVAAGGATIVLDAADGTGTADAVVIDAALGSTSGTLLITDSNNNIESLTVNATGDADQTIEITLGDFTGSTSADATLTVTGGAAGRAMTITNALSSDTVDFSGVLSDVTATLATGVDHTFTGGSGDDVITMTTGLTSADDIDGGDGDDTLSITQATTQSAALSIANIETLRLGGTGTASLNLAGTSGVATIDLEIAAGSTGTQTLRGVTTISTITIDADDNTAVNNDYQALTIVSGYAGTADALTIAVNSDSTNGMNGTEGLITASGVESLVISMTGGEAVQFGGFTSTTLETVTVSANTAFVAADTADLGTITGGTNNSILTYDSSDANIAVTVTVASLGDNAAVTLGSGDDVFATTGSTGTNITIDAGAGDDDITGAAGAEIINGGAGDDVIDGVGGGDTINGDAGDDTITGEDAEADTLDGGAGNDILDGDGGLDSLTGGDGSDVFVFGANVDTEAADLVTITDFSAGFGGDVLRLDLAVAGFAGGVAAALTLSLVAVAGAVDNVIIIDTADTNYASEADFAAAVEAANNNTLSYVGIYFDTTDSVLKLVADADSGIVAPTLVGVFSNINTTALAAAFMDSLVSQNFDLV
jgi:Ca2+-binding RTX toxin-like protein